MKESVSNLVNAIKDGNALDTEHSFADAMSDKLADKLDAMRKEVARNMFVSPESNVAVEDQVEEEIVEEDYEIAEFDQDQWEALSEEEQAEWTDVDLDNLDEAMSKSTAMRTYIKNKNANDFERHIGSDMPRKDMAANKKNMVKAKKVIKKAGGDMKKVKDAAERRYHRNVGII